MNSYTAQSLIRMTAAITATSTGVATDPTTVTLKIQTPDQVVADLSGTVQRDSTGNYHADYTATKVGLHQYEWQCTGAVVVSGAGQYLVSQGLF